MFCIAVSLSYGWWPARNLLLHKELVFTHRISAIDGWGKDVQAYVSYIYSVQSNWQPQFDQVVGNKSFEIDRSNAYVFPSDSALLAETIFLSQNYGSGFGEWPGYWKKPMPANRYDTIIVKNFNILKQHQISYNSFHYWVVLPLENLKKCFFKSDLLSSSNFWIKTLASLVFFFRTAVLFLGIFGTVAYCLINKKNNFILLMNFLFFSSWYILISAGDTYFLRNIEMRYLIQCDTLLILPAAYFINLVFVYLLKSTKLKLFAK